MDVPQFIHSPTEGHLGCFHFLAIMSKATINTVCSFFVWTYFSAHLGKYQGFVSFCKKSPNCLPKWLHHFAFPPAMKESSYYSTSLPVFGVVHVLDVDHFNRCVVISCCFNLHCPEDIGCGASFHMLISHLCVCVCVCVCVYIYICSLVRGQSCLFPIFKLSFCCCWVLNVLCIFWTTILYVFLFILFVFC